MEQNPLKIVQVDRNQSKQSVPSSHSRRHENEARLEREWKQNPEAFNPDKNSLERLRIERSWSLILKTINPQGKVAVDIGTGSGVFAIKLAQFGAKVHVTDIASNALKRLEKEYATLGITISQDPFPTTQLKDNAYDIVLCLDVLADLHPDDFRLAMAELSRIVKPEGYIVCSTPIDFRSEDALSRFVSLMTTELKIHSSVLSYHALYIRLGDVLKAPGRYYRSTRNQAYREKQIGKRKGIGHIWFRLNSNYILGNCWGIIAFLLKPFLYFYEQSEGILTSLEKLCHLVSDEKGVTHVIVSGQRRPLFEPPAEIHEKLPDRPPFRKERKWE